MATSVGNIVINVRYSQDRAGMNQIMTNLRSVNRQSQQMNRTLSQGFRSVTQQMRSMNTQSSSMLRTMNQGVRNVTQGMNSMQSSMKTGSNALAGLLTGFKAFVGLQIFSWLRKETSGMIEWASDLVEVANVVSTSFGDLEGEINKFASSSIRGFGVSEVSAKSFSGTMGAMLKSSGLATEEALLMSKTLTGLAGDLASFYNLDTDVAMEKLRSGMAGMVTPLRQLGINMTIANLESFAMASGITKSWQAMSQSEQMILRYAFLLKNTGDMQGDFAKTQGTWANQTRILKDNFQSLFAIFGKGFIVGILPIVKGLNVILVQLQKVGNAFVKLMEKITGKTFEEVNAIGGAVLPESMFTETTDGFEDVQSASKKTTDKIKKDMKSLAGFDSIIKLNEPSDSSTSGLGGLGGAGGGASFGLSDFGIDQSYVDTVMAEMDKWKNQEITFDVTLVLKKAKQLVTDALRYFGIEPLNLDFNLKFIGEKAWNSVMNVVDTVKNLGLLTLTIAVQLWNDVDAVGVIETVLGTFEKATKAIKTIVDALTPGLISFYNTALAPIVTWLGGAFKQIVVWLGEQFDKISTWFVANKPLITEFLTNIGETIAWIWGILEPILSSLLKEVLRIGGIVMDWVLEVLTFVMKTFNNLIDFIKAVFSGDLEGAFEIVGVIFEDAKQFIHDTFEKVKGIFDSVGNFLKDVFANNVDRSIELVKGFIKGFADNVGLNVDGILKFLDGLGAFLKDNFAMSWKVAMGTISAILEGFKGTAGDILDGIKKVFGGLVDFITGAFSSDWKKAFEGLKNILEGVWKGLGSILTAPLKVVVKAWNSVANKLKGFTIPEWVPGGLGGKEFKLPTIPEPTYQFADGGIITGRTWAEIGEKGTEVVFPLENSTFTQSFAREIAREIGGTSGSNTPQLNVNIDRAFGDARSMRELAKSLIREMELMGYRVGGAY